MTGPITVNLETFGINDPADVIETKTLALANKLPTLAEQINEATAAMNFNATNSTSSTSWTVADTGTHAFAIETGKSYVKGMTVKVASAASPTNWGLGDVTAASDGSVTVAFRQKNGSGTFSDWVISQNPEVPALRTKREERSSNTQITVADYGKLIEITSGTFTQTFDAAASLGNGFFITIKNAGDGYVTLDPNGSEQIDGRTSFHMFEGEMREIYCDGSSLRSAVLNPFFRKITASATYVIPPGYSQFGIRAWSGGGSGQRTNNASTASIGGGGGGCFETMLPASDFGTTEIVTIGAGGAAVTTVANGNVGGDTSFGSLLTVYAGNNWKNGGSAMDGLTDSATNGDESVYAGGNGAATTPMTAIWGGSAPSTNASADAGDALFGGGAGGSLNTSATVRAPGTSTFGGDGGAASSASNGTAGTAPGGGGGATQTGTQSGAGARGEVWFWGVI